MSSSYAAQPVGESVIDRSSITDLVCTTGGSYDAVQANSALDSTVSILHNKMVTTDSNHSLRSLSFVEYILIISNITFFFVNSKRQPLLSLNSPAWPKILTVSHSQIRSLGSRGPQMPTLSSLTPPICPTSGLSGALFKIKTITQPMMLVALHSP